MMKGQERRQVLLSQLRAAEAPLSGDALAKSLSVSRQVIVQDIALLRANGYDIISTNRGYLLQSSGESTRVFKVRHTQEEAEEEMNIIVDNGGCIDDVFVYHRVYGVIRTPMNLRSRWDIQTWLKELDGGRSSMLLNITDGWHYHTISAADPTALDRIKLALRERGFLAELTDYEPVDFHVPEAKSES